MGASVSTASSQETSDAYLSEQFYGSCDITCNNTQSGVNINLIDSYVSGSVDLDQKCSVNGNCMVSSTSDVSADVMFKAANSTNAKNASNLFTGSEFNFDASDVSSRQDIKQTILQNTTQKCNMASINSLTDVNILAYNSTIGGNIQLDQSGNTQGTCQLGNSMKAATTATAMASNKATSGKSKKGDKGTKGNIGSVVGIIVVIIIVFVFAHMYTSDRDKKVTHKKAVHKAHKKPRIVRPLKVNDANSPKFSSAKYVSPREISRVGKMAETRV